MEPSAAPKWAVAHAPAPSFCSPQHLPSLLGSRRNLCVGRCPAVLHPHRAGVGRAVLLAHSAPSHTPNAASSRHSSGPALWVTQREVRQAAAAPCGWMGFAGLALLFLEGPRLQQPRRSTARCEQAFVSEGMRPWQHCTFLPEPSRGTAGGTGAPNQAASVFLCPGPCLSAARLTRIGIHREDSCALFFVGQGLLCFPSGLSFLSAYDTMSSCHWPSTSESSSAQTPWGSSAAGSHSSLEALSFCCSGP